MRRLGVLVLFLLAVSVAVAADITIPEKFFRGIPQGDDTVVLSYTCPTSLDPETVASDAGWWNACAKIGLLTQRPNPNREFLQAYLAARKDPDLATIDVTYAIWSRGTQDEKAAARERIKRVVDTIVDRHQLVQLLKAIPVDETLLAERVAKNQAKLADEIGAPTTPSATTLITYCPGVPNNVRLNDANPLFPRLMEILKEPEVDRAYRNAVTTFDSFLDQHPMVSDTERNAELTRLMTPVLSQVR